MNPATELQLSQPYKQAQRAFANLLDRPATEAGDRFAARTALAALDRGEQASLARWLAWQTLARNPQALARIEGTDARLAARVWHHRGLLPGGRPRVSAALSRTA